MEEADRQRALSELRQTPGWRLVAAEIRRRIRALEGSILRRPVGQLSLEGVRRARVEADALRRVLRLAEGTDEE